MIGTVFLIGTMLGTAQAYVDPACRDVADQGPPEDYSEAAQTDYLLNFFSLATTFSPLHGAIPNEPGTGSMGVELAIIPPLSCERRLVLAYTKTEDTNKAPAAVSQSLSRPSSETVANSDGRSPGAVGSKQVSILRDVAGRRRSTHVQLAARARAPRLWQRRPRASATAAP